MQVTSTTQDAVDTLVDSVLLSSPGFKIAAIKAEAREIRGAPQGIVQFTFGGIEWKLGADAAHAAAQDLSIAGAVIEQPQVAQVGRRLAIAAFQAKAAAACLIVRAA
ncbi:hypothetical protein SGCZBJ_12675 [Caulobacter zeae]|uniref:Uncharacterized protein n=1 Tax=Caulobacter zeae TaxID=2055137 RepID=A0A2N5DG87_9CAUL|nr:hypothetical protein [Caulobacter zeae]PLR25083.1 hypothetical protein SGCZBJ_12675 [Caulobacter zeae]